jgi:hypothetical protein
MFSPLSPLVGERTAICSPWVSGVARPPIVMLVCGSAAHSDFRSGTAWVHWR